MPKSPTISELLSKFRKYAAELALLRGEILHLDSADLDELERIALRSWLFKETDPVIKDRGVRTVGEALYRGSPAALILMFHAFYEKEHKRLTHVLERDLYFAVENAGKRLEKQKQKAKKSK